MSARHQLSNLSISEIWVVNIIYDTVHDSLFMECITLYTITRLSLIWHCSSGANLIRSDLGQCFLQMYEDTFPCRWLSSKLKIVLVFRVWAVSCRSNLIASKPRPEPSDQGNCLAKCLLVSRDCGVDLDHIGLIWSKKLISNNLIA